ncbi:STAS domain-containing protein [Streptomyces sp. NPDC046465]|uniref:STAS domain-containing protein n=1 Tax=Streptomyces sp. NPDC046465 TaxID=3155810 RepID=UPI0033D0694D
MGTPPHRLSITALARSDVCAVLRLTGELDQASEKFFMDTVAKVVDASHRHIILDVTALTFCDSRGLNCLLALHWLLRRRSGDLMLAGVGRRLATVLEHSGSTALFSAHTSVGQALRSLPEPARPHWPPAVERSTDEGVTPPT